MILQFGERQNTIVVERRESEQRSTEQAMRPSKCATEQAFEHPHRPRTNGPSNDRATSNNEVIIVGCGGDKWGLGVLSRFGPSAPSVTRGVLSPVRGNVIAGWRPLSMRGLD